MLNDPIPHRCQLSDGTGRVSMDSEHFQKNLVMGTFSRHS
jgi:hypothetical protein